MLDWTRYIAIANKFRFRARLEDREDLKQNIILALGKAQLQSGKGSALLSDKSLFRIARYECQKYWREVKRNRRVISLNQRLDTGDGSCIELSETLPDDNAVNIDDWVDARTELLASPKRVVQIATKTLRGLPLNNRDHQYLWRYRRKHPRYP